MHVRSVLEGLEGDWQDIDFEKKGFEIDNLEWSGNWDLNSTERSVNCIFSTDNEPRDENFSRDLVFIKLFD